MGSSCMVRRVAYPHAHLAAILKFRLQTPSVRRYHNFSKNARLRHDLLLLGAKKLLKGILSDTVFHENTIQFRRSISRFSPQLASKWPIYVAPMQHRAHSTVHGSEFPFDFPILLWGAWRRKFKTYSQAFFLTSFLQGSVLSCIITANNFHCNIILRFQILDQRNDPF